MKNLILTIALIAMLSTTTLAKSVNYTPPPCATVGWTKCSVSKIFTKKVFFPFWMFMYRGI